MTTDNDTLRDALQGLAMAARAVLGSKPGTEGEQWAQDWLAAQLRDIEPLVNLAETEEGQLCFGL